MNANDILRMHGRDGLREAIDNAPNERIRPVASPDDSAPHPKKPPRFTLRRFKDIEAPDGDDYCVKGLLPRTGLAIVWGEPKCGKSFWTFDLLMHVPLGWKYRGHRVRQGPVVYVCLEGQRAFCKRREAFRKTKLKGGEDPPFFLIANPLSLAADRQALIEDIKRQVGKDLPAVVCIDTLNRSLQGSESSDEDMGNYIKAADAIRDAFDCLVVIVHHCPHDASRPRGHSSLIGALDVQIAIRKDEGAVVAELELAKDMEAGLVFVSRLETVELGRDSDGDPITSCVVREIKDGAAKTAAKKGKSRRSDDIANIKHAAVEAYGRLTDTAEKVPGFDGKPVLKVPVETLRDEVKSRGFLDQDEDGRLTDLGRTHWRRAKTDLFASKRFIEADGMFWRLAPDPN